MNTINILNTNFIILNSMLVNISDSFVDYSLKTGSGNGETRLYISNQRSSANGRFFEFDMNRTIPVINQKNVTNYYHPCIFKGIFLKDNLIKYMNDANLDYMQPKYDYNYNITTQFPRKLNEILSFPNEILDFTIHKQDGSMDVDRFYIGSGDAIWHQVRSYVLPFVSQYIIYKLQNELSGEIIYFFQVVHNSNLNREIYTPETADKIIFDYIQNDTSITSTEKEILITARLGQGLFRKNCLSLLNHCPFTNIVNPVVLRASHIIPWSRCLTNEDRLNPYNGLTLSPIYDILFDKGLISFENNGQLLISPQITLDIVQALNLQPIIVDIKNEQGLRDRFLSYHRNNIFINHQ